MIFVEFPAIFDYFHVYFATWSKYFATWDLFRGSGALPVYSPFALFPPGRWGQTSSGSTPHSGG